MTLCNAKHSDALQRSAECFRKRFDCPDEIAGCVFYETLLKGREAIFRDALGWAIKISEIFFCKYSQGIPGYMGVSRVVSERGDRFIADPAPPAFAFLRALHGARCSD